MSEIRIEREGDERRGRYVARIDGVEGEAELTFAQRSHGVVSADHTGAPLTMRGTGAALALVVFMVDDARRRGFRIAPSCSYVRAQFRKHPEWADVLAG